MPKTQSRMIFARVRFGVTTLSPKITAYDLTEATIRPEHRSNLIDLAMTLGTHLRLISFVELCVVDGLVCHELQTADVATPVAIMKDDRHGRFSITSSTTNSCNLSSTEADCCQWMTSRTLGMSMPMPNAFVQIM